MWDYDHAQVLAKKKSITFQKFLHIYIYHKNDKEKTKINFFSNLWFFLSLFSILSSFRLKFQHHPLYQSLSKQFNVGLD